MNKTDDKLLRAASVGGFVLAVLSLAFLLMNHSLISKNTFGMIGQACMVALMIWARITFGSRSFHAAANSTEGKLVTNGPYRLLRHPIYASIIYFVWIGVLSYSDVSVFIAASLITFGLVIRMIIEEKFLMLTYDEYKSYSAKTVRLIPFLF